MRSQTFEVNQQTTQIIPLPTSTEVIKNLGPTVSADLRQAVIQHIENEARVIADDLRTQYRRAHLKAAAKAGNLQLQLTQAVAAHKSAEEELATIAGTARSLTLSVIFWLGSASACLCEFFLTNTTLPFALSIASDSLMGIALSLAPAVAFVVVEGPIEKLLHSSSKKTCAAFWILVAVANLLTAGFIAGARHDIADWTRQVMAGVEGAVFAGTALNLAILSISLVLVLDGALFLLGAREHGGRWLRHSTAQRTVAQLRTRILKLDVEKEQDATEAELFRQQMEGNRPELVAQSFVQAMLVELAKVAEARPSSLQSVEARLGLKPGQPDRLHVN
jgi:hypothetical protein